MESILKVLESQFLSNWNGNQYSLGIWIDPALVCRLHPITILRPFAMMKK